jgi:flagellar basal-body rod protein FlgB
LENNPKQLLRGYFYVYRGRGVLMNNISLNLLVKNLDGLWLRQKLTMDNIANYSTPGYKSKVVDFESNLRDKIKDINSENVVNKSLFNEAIENSSIIVSESDDLSLRLDENNVDLEKENLDLAKTQLQYMYTVTEMNSYFSKLKSVISEGKK